VNTTLDDKAGDPWQITADLQRQLDARTAELQENKERYALVSQAIAEGIYDWDIVTNALWVSPRLIEIFGLNGGSLSAADWSARVHRDDFERYQTALRDCFKAVAAPLRIPDPTDQRRIPLGGGSRFADAR
jgi:PAS domain-containing protein